MEIRKLQTQKKHEHLKKYRLVALEWKDAQSDAEWGTEESIKKWVEQDFIVFEIGWLIAENKKYVVISNQVAEDGDIGNRTKIPRDWIRRIKTVKVDSHGKGRTKGQDKLRKARPRR